MTDEDALGNLTEAIADDDRAVEVQFRRFAQRTGRDGAVLLDRQGANWTVFEEGVRFTVEFSGADRNAGESVVDAEVVGDDGRTIAVAGRFFDDGEQYVDGLLDENEATLRDVLEAFDTGNSTFYEDYLDARNNSSTDAHQWLSDNIGQSDNATNIRGTIGEEIVQPDVLRRSDADYDFSNDSVHAEFEEAFETGPRDTGFDGLVETGDGRLVIVETKVKNANGRVTPSEWFEDRKNGEYPDDYQFSDAWIQQKFTQMAEEAESDPAKRAFLDRLEHENYISITETPGGFDVQLNPDKIERRFIPIQDGPVTGELASYRLRPSERTLRIDRVDTVKVGDVFAIGSTSSSIAGVRLVPSASPSIVGSQVGPSWSSPPRVDAH